MEDFSCAYCKKQEVDWSDILSFRCEVCNKYVHYGCIRSVQPSSLLDDTFFNFKCEDCGENKKEEFVRSNLSWLNVVLLTLYNLQKTSQGRCGFFHWKKHVCVFIETHWTTFFGFSRKKTTLWMGTVAGTLSSGCPTHFTSGSQVVEQGYWQLTWLKPPLPGSKKIKNSRKKAQHLDTPVDLYPESRRCKRSAENSLVAAIQLKEKATPTTEGSRKNKGGKKKSQQLGLGKSQTSGKKRKGSKMDLDSSPQGAYISDDQDSNSMASSELSSISAASSHLPRLQNSGTVMVNSQQGLDFCEIEMDIAVDDIDDDLDIDIGTMGSMTDGMFDFRPLSPDISDILDMEKAPNACWGQSLETRGNLMEARHRISSLPSQQHTDTQGEPHSDTESEGPSEQNISEESEDSQMEDEDFGSERDVARADMASNDEVRKISNKGRPRKKRRLDDVQPSVSPPRLKRISVFEEVVLLQKLNTLASKQVLRPELAQLRRKLICNQTNREYGLPVFDLEILMEKLEKLEKLESLPKEPEWDKKSFFPKLPAKVNVIKETRDLDRFMMHVGKAKDESRKYTSFYQRLVGLEDHELKPMISPYTTRVLLPFIWRNYKPSKLPLKMKLLQEIQAHHHRHDPTWVTPPSPPIDFCYIRVEHIPSVNALCREYFWPGIDMSECLQYPDFSCVVLYKKIVIAFAFMVPDRGYNEAYISFIFTHPEWRGAGIATFMLYHLIQTCMGKDVLLHVSVTNPAMLLYQKFGFKCQELILNFYHKYFPLNCKDSTHAFLMRLSR